MPLSAIAIRNAKPGERPIKMFDARGLFLLVTPAGGKWWRLRYPFGGKEKLLSLGTYPDVSLKVARQERSANSFEVVAREWHTQYVPGWAVAHSVRILRRFERDVFPWISGRPTAEGGPAAGAAGGGATDRKPGRPGDRPPGTANLRAGIPLCGGRRAGDLLGGYFPAPRLLPRSHPLFEVRQDALGNLGINIGSGHRRNPFASSCSS
jgi:hypothetical protein